MRQWLYNLPQWQLQLFVVVLVVTGLCVLQLAFAMGGLHDLDDVPAVVAQGAPAPVEPPPAPEEPESEGAE